MNLIAWHRALSYFVVCIVLSCDLLDCVVFYCVVLYRVL